MSNSIEWNGETYTVDDNGFLVDRSTWNENWVEYVMHDEGVTLTPAHWTTINFLRSYTQVHGGIPTIRVLVKNLGIKLSEIYDLFPSGPAKGACRAAGVPRPTGCLA